MSPRTRRELALLALVSTAPLALGYAMHLDHEASHTVRATAPTVVRVTEAIPTPIAIATPTASTPVVTEPPAPDLAFAYGESFAFVAYGGEEGEVPLLVLDPDPGPWATSEPRVTYDEGGEVHVRRDVDLDAIPPRLRNRIGASYTLYDGTQESCTATMGEPFLFADFAGHDEPDESWLLDPEGDGAPMTLAEFAWSDGRHLLVAPMLGADCEYASWARLSHLPDPRAYEPHGAPSRDQGRLARRSFLRQPMLRELKTEFDEFVREVDWLEYDAARPPKLWQRLTSRAWTDPTGRLRVVTHQVGGDEFGDCGGLTMHYGVSLVSDDGATVDHVLAGYDGVVRAVLDLDGDGTPEVVVDTTAGWSGTTLRTFGDDGWVDLAHLRSQPFFGCPC